MKRHLSDEYFSKSTSYYENCIGCGKCTKCCPIIGKEARLAKDFLNNLKDPSSVEFEDSISCLKCGYCKAVCPKSVDIGELLFELKKTNVRFSRDKKYRKKYRVIQSHQKNSFRDILINTTNHKRVFFPGCSLSASNPSLVKDLSRRLEKDHIGLFSACCASPSSISGDAELFDKNTKKLSDRFEREGVEEVIVACSNCYIALKKLKTVKVSSIYEVLNQGDYIEQLDYNSKEKFIIHDPCPTRFEDHIHESARGLLGKYNISFSEFKDSKKNTSCCGDGSMVSVLNADLSKLQLTKRVDQAQNNKIISYCQSCVNNFKSQNNDARHILELLVNGSSKKTKDVSVVKKWTNRYMISKHINKIK